MMSEDPIKQIEDEKTYLDFGKMAYLVYRGALEEGASPQEAYIVTSAYFRGIAGGAADNPEDKPDE